MARRRSQGLPADVPRSRRSSRTGRRRYRLAEDRCARQDLQRGTAAHGSGYSMTSLVAEARLRVRYAETDQMGVAYYGNYLTWFEVARVEWCKAAGFNYRDMERQDGALLVVAEATCRYRAPARLDDELAVRTLITK